MDELKGNLCEKQAVWLQVFTVKYFFPALQIFQLKLLIDDKLFSSPCRCPSSTKIFFR